MTSLLLITISDETLDPGEEALHPCVDAGSGVRTTGPVAHNSDQDELALSGNIFQRWWIYIGLYNMF